MRRVLAGLFPRHRPLSGQCAEHWPGPCTPAPMPHLPPFIGVPIRGDRDMWLATSLLRLIDELGDGDKATALNVHAVGRDGALACYSAQVNREDITRSVYTGSAEDLDRLIDLQSEAFTEIPGDAP